MVSPFLEIDGRKMVIVNWTPGISSEQILVLRALKDEEIAWLEKELADAYFDVFARLFPAEADRWGGSGSLDASAEAT